MKCAVAVISSCIGRSVRRWNRTTNHAGMLGLRNDTSTAVFVRRKTCAFVTGRPQIGAGCGRSVVGDSAHPSHRRVPMTVALVAASAARLGGRAVDRDAQTVDAEAGLAENGNANATPLRRERNRVVA